MKSNLDNLLKAEMDSMDTEIKNSLLDWYYEPWTDSLRCEESGMAYSGNDDTPEYVFQTEFGKKIN